MGTLGKGRSAGEGLATAELHLAAQAVGLMKLMK